MKFNTSIFSKILVILILALSPALNLHSQVTVEDVTRSLIIACNEVSLGEKNELKAFRQDCKDGDCVKAAQKHLTGYSKNIQLVKEIDRFCDETFLKSIDLNAPSSDVAKKLVDKINKQKKIQWFINKNGRSASVQDKLKAWLDKFTPKQKPASTPSNTSINPNQSSGNDDTWPNNIESVPGDSVIEEDKEVEEVEQKSGGNFVFILIIVLLLGAIGLLAFLYYKLNMEKEALEQSSKRLRDESAQFNAEQYKLKRLLSERERQLRALMEDQESTELPSVEAEDINTPEENTEVKSSPPVEPEMAVHETEVTEEEDTNPSPQQVEKKHEEVESETTSSEESNSANPVEPQDNPGHVSYPPNVEGQRSVLFFSAPNAQGEFPSSAIMRDYSPEAVIRVFLRNENADYGEFQVVTNPTSQRHLLANWEHTLAHFAVPVNPEHPEPRSIELERAGGIRESEGVWKVVRKAKVRFM